MAIQSTSAVGKLTLLAFGLVLSLILAEGLARMMLGNTITLYPRFHDIAHYDQYTIRKLRPNSTFQHRSVDGIWKFTTNSKGFRADREYAYEKPQGVLRIICAGDSQTQGFECAQDKTYAAVIQRQLPPPRGAVEVINAGVSGFGTAEALVLLEHEAIKYSPDVFVLGFFANDLDDNVKADLFRVRDGELIEHKYQHVPAARVINIINALPLLRWLSQNSYAYSYVFNAAWEWKKKAFTGEKAREFATELAVRAEDAGPEVTARKQELCSALVRRMHKFCKENGIKLLILDIPQLRGGWGDGQEFESSIPKTIASDFRKNSDLLITSDEVLGAPGNDAVIFVPNGQRHVSESTHHLMGVACAEKIAASVRAP